MPKKVARGKTGGGAAVPDDGLSGEVTFDRDRGIGEYRFAMRKHLFQVPRAHDPQSIDR